MKLAPSLALRSLRARPSRTLLTTFGIVLGVSVIVAISITNAGTLESIERLFGAASGKANLVITSATSSGDPIRQDVTERARSVPGVAEALPTLHLTTLLADDVGANEIGMSLFGAVSGGLQIYGIDPAHDHAVREYQLVAGRFLLPDPDAQEIVLVKEYAEEKQIDVGRDVRILTPTGVERLRVVGLIAKAGPGQLNNGAFGVMPLRAAQTLFDRAGELDQIEIVAIPQLANSDGLETLRSELQTRLTEKYRVIYPAMQGKRVTQMLNTYQLGLNFFSVIALFVGAFLTYNAFSMTVVERTREIGMLRTIGMTQAQLLRQILGEALVLGILGATLGVALGIVLAQGLVRLMELLVNQPVTTSRVPLDGLILGLGVGLGVTVVAALIPAWQASRISPLEALRIRGRMREGWLVQQGWRIGLALIVVSALAFYFNPLPPALRASVGSIAVFTLFVGAALLIPLSVSIWERMAGPLLRHLYGNEGQLGARNTERSRIRTALTVAALMIGVAMILGIRSLTEAFQHDIGDWINVYIGGDLYVYSTMPLDAGFGSRLESVPGVLAAAPVRYLETERVMADGSGDPLALMAVDPASYRRVTSFVFSAKQGDPGRLMDRLAQGEGIFISSVVSEKYGIAQGDSIRLETRRGEHDFPVIAVVVDFFNQGQVIQASWRDMQRYFGADDASSFMLKLAPGESPDMVKTRIDDLYGKSRHLTIQVNHTLKTSALELTRQAFTLFDVLALIAVIVAGLGVVNTMMMNVLERTHEIGMLRSMGMTRLQVVKMVLAEAGLMGLLGGAFGLTFGLFLSQLFLVAITQVQGYTLEYVLPVQGIFVSVLIALVVSQLAGLLPARRAAGVEIIESIRFE